MKDDDVFNYSVIHDGSNHSNNTEKVTLLALAKKNVVEGIHVKDNVLSEVWCDRVYDYATTEMQTSTDEETKSSIVGSGEQKLKTLREANRPWGNYIETKEIFGSEFSSEELWLKGVAAGIDGSDLCEKAIALEAVRSLLAAVGDLHTSEGAPFDMKDTHGAAVWCLSSTESDSVDYHIDYAELFRYETQVVVPPLVAGTVQVSAVWGSEQMQGGELAVNGQGIAHYRRFGYKGKLAGPQALEADLQAESSGWVCVPYRRGRGTLFGGPLPHLARPVRFLAAGLRRVVLGVNVFPRHPPLNECCLRAPEHSRAFNRTVKLYQALKTSSSSSSSSGSSASSCPAPSAASRLRASDLLKNPRHPLARLLVLAARKVKQSEREASKETAIT
mmetsp:Transcript_27933/g.39679  ORF Transcript_27933/g.39679 Transcript_27933/m.39679 type:complete len:388 (-) Transcript_27933:147-1310(-)